MSAYSFSVYGDSQLAMAPTIENDVSFTSKSHLDSKVMSDLMPLCQIVTPIGMLGYGFDEELIRKQLLDLEGSLATTALILDSGSTDGGPLKLATGSRAISRSAYERDLGKLLALSHEFKVKVIISSAGGDGTDARVDDFLDIIREIVGDANKKYASFSQVKWHPS